MEFRILGPLEVVDGPAVVRIAAGNERRLLLFLLLRAPAAASLTSIVDALWPDAPPSTAQKVVQNYVLRLRKALGPDAIQTVADGYALVTGPNAVDAQVAAARLQMAREALAGGDPEAAARHSASAVALWRGEALADVRGEAFAQPEIARLDELRLSGIEDGFDADLATGRHAELVPELRRHVGVHPLRERARAQLMLALYRSGQQADALAEYRCARQALAEQGLEPQRELRQLEQAMLNHAAELEFAAPASAVSSPAGPPVAIPSQAAKSWRRRTAAVAAAGLVSAVVLVVVLVLALEHRAHERPLWTLQRNTLAELDPTTGKVERSFTVGTTPTSVAVADGAVWTTSFADRTVTRIDIRSGRSSIVGSPSTPTAIVAGSAGVWIGSSFDGTVERLDPSSGSPLAVVHLLPGLTDLASGRGRVWAVNELHGSLSAIDAGTNRVRTTPGFARPVGVAFGARNVWVTEEGARRLDAVDPANGNVVQRLPLELRPGPLAYGAGALWIVDPADGAVTRVDAFSGRQQVITVGDVPSRVAVAGRQIWVAIDRDHALVVLDAATGEVLRRLRLARAADSRITPGGLAASPGACWLAVQAV